MTVPLPQPTLDCDQVKRLYVDEDWTTREIAEHLGCTLYRVRKALRDEGVRRRRTKPNRGVTRLLYARWVRMRSVVAKGIPVCEEWKRFRAFSQWATEHGFVAGLSLDRVDESKGFSPDNCRWASRAEIRQKWQRPAPRKPRDSVEAFGEVKTITDWAEDARCRVTRESIVTRLRRGQTPEEAITLAPRTAHGKLCPPEYAKSILEVASHIDWAAVRRLYIEESRSKREIAEQLGVDEREIRLGLRRLGVERKRVPRIAISIQRLNNLWRGVLHRCRNPRAPAYRYYGAKGIDVCQEWNDFEVFKTWAIAAGWRPGLALQRIDRRRDYSEQNCRWVTKSVASLESEHAGSWRGDRWKITAFVESKGPVAWSRDPRCSVSSGTIVRRLRNGADPESAITDPAQRTGLSDLKFKANEVPIDAFGELKCAMDWTRDRRCSIVLTTLLRRLHEGWDAEDAISARPYARRRTTR